MGKYRRVKAGPTLTHHLEWQPYTCTLVSRERNNSGCSASLTAVFAGKGIGSQVGIAFLISVQMLNFWPLLHWIAFKSVALLSWCLNRSLVILLMVQADWEHTQATALVQSDRRQWHGAGTVGNTGDKELRLGSGVMVQETLNVIKTPLTKHVITSSYIPDQH